ncbi:MAG TPA: response regulator, partial [Chryseolinea sp.]
MEPVRVSVYEDNGKLRDLLELLIGNTEGFVMAGSYPDCTHVTQDAKRDHPDVVIMDIDMPGRSGIEGVQLVKELDVNIKV